jgi:hypothetical protein
LREKKEVVEDGARGNTVGLDLVVREVPVVERCEDGLLPKKLMMIDLWVNDPTRVMQLFDGVELD